MLKENIKQLKKELNLSNADLAKCFGMTYGAYANSTAKERYENALLHFYKLAKKGWEKNKRKNLISDNQTIKHEPKPLIIHGVSKSFYCQWENNGIVKKCDEQCEVCLMVENEK
jgi:DNA-binding XRE family transcriptional regulator